MPAAPSARSPLEPRSLQRAAGAAWSVRLLAEAPSTNAVAGQEPVDRLVVVADHQTAGRGRLDRTWSTPPGSALTFSAVVDPALPDRRWPLLPLAAGLAVADAVRRSGVVPALKWPNDVLVGQRKLCGILVERVDGPASRPLAVVGVGINTDLRSEELPLPTATSLALEGGDVDRTALLGAVLAALDVRMGELRRDPSAFVDSYREACDTVGRPVQVHLPAGRLLEGLARTVDAEGRLVVDTVDGEVPVGAGDVVHVRAAG